jgi:ABC-type Fe3+/spermidine/putrescine transport system ATPase subunit
VTHVALTQLTKTYGAFTAVHQLSLNIPSGQITALLGPSGCGKTTTLKMLAGLIEPTSGEIAFDGNSVLNVPAERRGAVMVFQNHLLFPYLSVAENVAFGLKMRGVDEKATAHQVSELLAHVQLAGFEKRKPHELSGGQQQRVALARALITQPRVLLLDEPLSNLDAHLRDEMRELILRLQRERGITTVVVTHDQQEAVILADAIALLFHGELQQFAEPRAFYERPVNERVARFFGGSNFLHGTKTGLAIATPHGIFHAPVSPLTGPVTFTVRPEAIQLVSESHLENVVRVQVVESVYVGTHTRLKCQAGDLQLEVVTHEAAMQVGENVTLYLPPEKLWVF